MLFKRTVAPEISHPDPDPKKGLSSAEVQERKDKGLTNSALVKVQKSYAQIVFSNFFTFFGCVLFGVSIIFLIFRTYLIKTGHEDLAAAYFGISKFFYLAPLIVNIVIGTIQECRSKHVLDKLRLVSDSKYTVVRGGTEVKISSEDIVLDDVVKLSSGEQIAADMQLLSGYLEVNESLLTGESDDVKKEPNEGHDGLLSGSSIVSGSGYAVVVAVGRDTYANRLQKKVKNIVKSKSELMRNIYGIINAMSILLFIIVGVVVGTMAYKIWRWGGDSNVFISQATRDFISQNYGHGVPASISLSDPYSWSVIITTASAFAIGVIPTGLVLLTSVTLAVSVISLAKQHTLIQELYSLENLSRIDTICLDKTGTLTDGSMSVAEVFYVDDSASNQQALARLLAAFLGAFENPNATSLALIQRFGTSKDLPIQEALPFSSSRKRSEVIFKDGGDVCLGAPEYLLEAIDKKWLDLANAKAAMGLRVLALTLNGRAAMLLALKDNIRPSAHDTIAYFNANGVSVKIISGDNPITVQQIAKECGVSGAEAAVSLENVPLEQMEEYAAKYTVFGRVNPDQKEALVAALQKQGHKVAMTGDGVNDILALRKANSSISFHNATDAAKSCADVVLMDNDFGHLKEVVTQGRRVVNNIQRTAILFLMKTFCISLLAFLLIPFQKGQSEFTIENIYLMQTGIIAIGGLMLSVETSNKPLTGSFKTTVYSRALASGLFMCLGALIPCILNVIPSANGGTLVNSDNARSMISLLTTIAGTVVLVMMCWPFTKYRGLVIGVSTFVDVFLALALPTVYVGGRSWSFKDVLSHGADSELLRNFFNLHSRVFTDLGWIEWTTMGVFVLIGIPLYLLVMHTITLILNKGILKAEEEKAKP